jgi:hypothetical protein
MILFAPDGRELTRLPGEVDAEQYMRVLSLGMGGARPVKDTLAVALSASTNSAGWKLSPDDWRMLAYYSWLTDEQQLVPTRELPSTLRRLAQSCPADQSETASRLELKALAAAATAKGAKPSPDADATARLLGVLADAKLARENFDTLRSFHARSPASSPCRSHPSARGSPPPGPLRSSGWFPIRRSPPPTGSPRLPARSRSRGSTRRKPRCRPHSWAACAIRWPAPTAGRPIRMHGSR